MISILLVRGNRRIYLYLLVDVGHRSRSFIVTHSSSYHNDSWKPWRMYVIYVTPAIFIARVCRATLSRDKVAARNCMSRTATLSHKQEMTNQVGQCLFSTNLQSSSATCTVATLLHDKVARQSCPHFWGIDASFFGSNVPRPGLTPSGRRETRFTGLTSCVCVRIVLVHCSLNKNTKNTSQFLLNV